MFVHAGATLDCAFYVVRSAPARSNLSMPPSDTRRLGDDAATDKPRASRRGCACCVVSPPHQWCNWSGRRRLT